MNITPIRTESDYEVALAEIAELMELDPPEGTEELDRLDVLATLVEAYEAKHYPITPPHPIEAIKIRMEDKGMSRQQLCAATGILESKLSEVLNLKRALSLNMIRRIGPLLDLPIETLVRPYAVTERQSVNA